MDYLSFAPAGAAEPAASLPGSRRLLHADRALSMRARQAGRLRVTQGRVWITFDNAAQDARVRAGDHVLASGDSVPLAAGQTVVMQSWERGRPAQVQWEAAPLASALPVFCAAQGRTHLASWLAGAGRLVRQRRNDPSLACCR